MKSKLRFIVQSIVIIFYILIAVGSATEQQTVTAKRQKQIELETPFKLKKIISNIDIINPENLNEYKYFYFPTLPNSIQYYNDILWNQINDTLKKCGIYTSNSKYTLRKKGVNQDNIITCHYQQEVIPGPGIFSIIYFTNYKNDTVFFWYNYLRGLNYLTRSRAIKSMDRTLKIFQNYHHEYNEAIANESMLRDKEEKTIKTDFVTKPVNYQNNKSDYKFAKRQNTIKTEIYISDVDKNIPETHHKYNNRFALIIGNEDYASFQKGLRSEANVDYAINDANTFKKYAVHVLGIDEEHIIFQKNATSIKMNRAINQMNMIIKSMKGNAEVFVYYAGHGFPDPKTKEASLIPVDVTSMDLSYAIKLHTLYAKLTQYNAKRVIVFLDACFSGGGREQGLLASRGISIEPKKDIITGNIIVFSSSSSTEASLPYNEKKHGMFTYFLLKELQSTSAKITYGDLADYLNNQVNIASVIMQAKEQNPEINVGYQIKSSWRNWNINN